MARVTRIALDLGIGHGTYGFQEIAPASGTRIAKQRNRILDAAKAARDRALSSEVVRRLRIGHVYFSAEIAPPFKIDEWQKLRADLDLIQKFIRCNCWKDLTVKQAWLLLLVAVEVTMWFFVGECIGKFHIVGYKV